MTAARPMNVAMLGLGAMGARMARRLLDAGHRVSVWNRTPSAAAALVSAGARLAATPADAARGQDAVFSMVRDDEAARAVWLDAEAGALAAMTPGAVAVDCSTVTPDWAREFHQAAGRLGLPALDAPVAGSRPQAEAGRLIFLVGGEPETLARVEPILAAMGEAVHLAGAGGSGAAVKLLVNTLFGVQVVAAAELLQMARRAGLDVARTIEVVGATPVASLAFKGAANGMLSNAFEPMFPMALAEKDFGYALSLASGLGAAPLAGAAHGVIGKAIDAGLAEANLTALVKVCG